MLNQGVQAPDLWRGWLPARFGRSQVPSCVASEQFQIQPGIPCSFPLLAFKQNLPRFPQPGISGFPELFTRCIDFQISSLTWRVGQKEHGKKNMERYMQDLHTPQFYNFEWLFISCYGSLIYFFFSERMLKKMAAKIIHTNEAASTNQYPPFLSSELDIFT